MNLRVRPRADQVQSSEQFSPSVAPQPGIGQGTHSAPGLLGTGFAGAVLTTLKPLVGKAFFQLATFRLMRPLIAELGLRTNPDWFKGRLVSVPIDSGKRIMLAGIEANYLVFQLYWRGHHYYEPISMLLARRLAAKCAVFIDAGANIGWYSLVLGSSFPYLAVYAFEPSPRVLPLLRTNATLNRLARLKVLPLALSDRVGDCELFVPDSDMSASLEPSFERETVVTPIESTTLDAFVATSRLPGPALLKIDVEGHEAALFRGGREFIAATKPDIICEVTGRMDRAVTSWLASLGYHFYRITNQGFELTTEMNLVVRGPLLFLNYFLSTRPVEEVDALFRELEPQVRKLDLPKSSKAVDPALIKELEDRSRAVQEDQKDVVRR